MRHARDSGQTASDQWENRRRQELEKLFLTFEVGLLQSDYGDTVTHGMCVRGTFHCDTCWLQAYSVLTQIWLHIPCVCIFVPASLLFSPG